jgi:hypothetical protein
VLPIPPPPLRQINLTSNMAAMLQVTYGSSSVSSKSISSKESATSCRLRLQPELLAAQEEAAREDPYAPTDPGDIVIPELLKPGVSE